MRRYWPIPTFVMGFLAVVYGLSTDNLFTSGVPETNSWFEKDAVNSQLSPERASYSISWGDPNQDGQPDLWVGGHGMPELFINSNGVLANQTKQWITAPGADFHGAIWMDYDNDGDDDLLELAGGARGRGAGGRNRIFINHDSKLNVARKGTGIEMPGMRARAPLWIDLDQDGYLDVVLTAAKSESSKNTVLLQSAEGLFRPAIAGPELPVTFYSEYVQLAYIKQATPSLIFHHSHYPGPIYNVENGKLKRMGTKLPRSAMVRDSGWMDVNRDQIDDYVTVSSRIRSVFSLYGSDTLNLSLLKPAAKKSQTFSFSADDDIAITVYPVLKVWWALDSIFVGDYSLEDRKSKGLVTQRGTDWVTFPASRSDASKSDFEVPADKSLSIFYDNASARWHVRIEGNALESANLIVTSKSPISAPLIHDAPSQADMDHSIFLSNLGTYSKSRLDIDHACGSVVAADFDNDSDLDLFLACGETLNNVADIVLENIGDAVFVVRKETAMAMEAGAPDSIAVADYNMDGMLDIVVSNGAGLPPFRKGPISFYKGVVNSNNWIKLDLTPVLGNAYPVGARVVVHANNTVQARTVDTGIHRGGQHYKLLHFGLGKSDRVDRIDVLWPSGTKTLVEDIPSGQVYRLLE